MKVELGLFLGSGITCFGAARLVLIASFKCKLFYKFYTTSTNVNLSRNCSVNNIQRCSFTSLWVFVHGLFHSSSYDFHKKCSATKRNLDDTSSKSHLDATLSVRMSCATQMPCFTDLELRVR